MIVPRSRLLLCAGVVFLPFPTLASAIPTLVPLTWVLVTTFVILAASDAFLGFGRLEGIGVDLPQVVRLSKGRKGEIGLRIKNEQKAVRSVLLGLAFPGEICSPDRSLIAEFPRESRTATLLWPCRALKQGKYTLNKCFVGVVSPLGFWVVRGRVPVCSEIRVYPNLFHERKNLASLFLNRGLGIHATRQIGKGRDFEHLREYLPGDHYEDIHWKGTAKWGHPITKVFQVERTQEVYIIMDASRLSARSAGDFRQAHPTEGEESAPLSTTVMERFITAALIMGLATERQGDMFGLLTFDDRVRGFMRAKNGRPHYNACRDTLYTLEPQMITPDFNEIFTFIGTRIRRRALLIFLTNLDDPVLAESFLSNIGIISKRHLVLVNMLRPAGARPLFSSRSVESIDDLYRGLGGHFLWGNIRETEKVLKRRGVGFALMDNEKMCAQLVSQYLNVKQRQLL